MRSTSRRALLAVLLVLLLEVPVAFANHAGGAPSAPGVDAGRVDTGVPAGDTARDDVLARHAEVARRLNEFLTARGLPPETLLPEVPANVFLDRVHPGGRVGGLGPYRESADVWRVHATHNGTYWTMTDAATGTYRTMDDLLVLPAIDLSAYLLQTGELPYANRGGAVNDQAQATVLAACPPLIPGTRQPAGPLCLQVARAVPEVAAVSDQINLMLRHRHNLVHGKDGAQVLLFERDPLQPGAIGRLLPPQIGVHNDSVLSLRNPPPGAERVWTGDTAGYTGYQDWTTESFDLTPWAGRKIWIAFRVATSLGASADPDYFTPRNFPVGDFYGWALDDIEIVAPAHPVNLKVESIFGPTYRASPGSPRVAAPNETVTLGAEILHAGAVKRLARATLRVEVGGVPTEHQFEANLSPGEVWTPNVTIRAPDAGTIRVQVEASNPGPLNTTHTDPSLADNVMSASFDVVPIRRLDATLEASDVMIDDGQPVHVEARVVNTGNVPLPVDVRLLEVVRRDAGDIVRPQPPQSLTLLPGENATLRWPFEGDLRGEHRLVMYVNATDIATNATTAFYVHASPPPVFNATEWPPAPEWNRTTADVPLPLEDDWVWVATGSSRVSPILRALPTAEAVQAGGRFRDLRLFVRYMSAFNTGDAAVVLATVPAPYQVSVPPVVGNGATIGDASGSTFWKTVLPRTTQMSPGTPLGKELALSWHVVDIPVDPQAAEGYAGIWTTGSPELRVVPRIENDVLNMTKFYLDELRLTGVPIGGDEADRVDVVRITGAEPFISRSAGATPADGLRPGVVAPAEPSVCRWEVSFGLDWPNCWRPFHRSQLEKLTVRSLHWQNATEAGLPATFPDGSPALWTYRQDKTTFRAPERLVTPVFRFDEVVQPRLSFLTLYHFPGGPRDWTVGSNVPSYTMSQVGIVQIQYREDDGDWSDFHRLRPLDGYPSPLVRTPSNVTRQPGDDVFFTAGDGFHHPAPCTTSGTYYVCDAGGYHMNLGHDGKLHWMDFGPYDFIRPEFELSVPGVNLSNREVRIGFQASTGHSFPGCPQAACSSLWMIGDVRVTSVDRFAVDAAVTSIGFDVPYDWRALGLGPGTTVPLNVTVENRGLYPERFVVNVSIGLHKGDELEHFTIDAGLLAPGERRSLIREWVVPLAEDRAYVVTATISPASGADERTYNDRLQLGAQGELLGRTRADAGLVASVFPQRGRDSLARHMPVTLVNRGNVPLTDVRLSRVVERLEDGRTETVVDQTWRFTEAIPPDPRGIAFQRLSASPEIAPEASFVTPGRPGDYLARFRVTVAEREANADDNVATLPFTAVAPIFSDDFETPLRWPVEDPGAWGQAPGFRSPQALLAQNRSVSGFHPRTDTWVETPSIPLSSAMTAVVNAYLKYDLEPGYDGARVEVSKDGERWIPLRPTDERGVTTGYRGVLVPSNPFSTGPGDAPAAITGDSRTEPVEVDGWVPYSFNLQDVPELSEAVGFRELSAPPLPEDPEEPRFLPPGTFYTPSMVLDPQFDDQRWELQNETVTPSLTERIWWSGPASTTRTPSASILRRDVDVSDLDPNDTLALTWWDWRAGSRGDDWNGVSGNYRVNLTQETDQLLHRSVAGDLEILDRNGRWFQMRLEAKRELVDVSRPLRVEFRFESLEATANSMGWGLDEILLASTRVEQGARVMIRNYTELDEETGIQNWTAFQDARVAWTWSRVNNIPDRGIPWARAELPGADGLHRTMWRADIPASAGNLDARLVTPAVDLGELGGARAALRLTHAYDLAWREEALGPGMMLSQRKYYRAGAVEVQVLNRTTGQWDPWKQLFAQGATPSDALGPRVTPGGPAAPLGEGAPYNATLVESGDTFARYRRTISQPITIVQTPYQRSFDASVSYAFAGVPANPLQPWTTSEFDLTPYAGQRVRFGFHVYAGAVDPQNQPRHWTIDKAEVVGYVLSSPDVKLRFRVGTDASIREGSFLVDQLEVSGRTYTRSVGLHLDPIPMAAGANGNIVVSGNITNYGPETRRLLAVGVRDSRLHDFRLVTPVTVQPGSPPPGGYRAISGPFELSPAGTANSSARVEFVLGIGPAGEKYDLSLEVLEGTPAGAGLEWKTVEDEVPGRARRSMEISSVHLERVALSDVALSPSWLDAPGAVVASGTGRNVGTVPIPVMVEARWTYENGTQVAANNVSLGSVAPGRGFSFALPAVTLPWAGNYTLRLDGQGIAPFTTYYRVARSDVNGTFGFDGAWEGWEPKNGNWSLGVDEPLFGNGSVLFGLNNSAYFDDRLRIMDWHGNITTPPLELKHTRGNRSLVFWHRPLMTGGLVDVHLETLDANFEVDPRCGSVALARFTGRTDRWQLANIPLTDPGPTCLLSDRAFRLRFEALGVSGQGWRLDGVTLATGLPVMAQALPSYNVTDSAVKEYPVVITNAGHVPKDVRLAIDPLLSRLSPAQAAWFDVSPALLRIEPGSNATATLRLTTPAARGAFPQVLDVVLSATDAAAPYAPGGLRLTLDFRPLPRQDLSVAASIDGKPLGQGRPGIEEAVPHEVSVVVTNQGAEASGPTDVLLRIVDDDTGEALWEQTRALPGLGVYAETEAAFIVSGSWRPDFGDRGNRTLRVVVDPDRLLVDYDRTNDDVSLPLEVVRLIRPDLRVDERAFAVSTPGGVPLYEAVPGQLVRIAGAVTNDGHAEARDVTIRLLAGTSILKEQHVPVLRPGETFHVRANQFAPNASVVYRVMAFTPDLELLPDNNERSLELPIFPAEVRIDAEGIDLLEPGTTRVVNVTVADDGPYPLTLRLDAKSKGPLARLDRTQLALGPGEARPVALRIQAAPDEAAGTHLVVVRALDEDGVVRAQRTISVRVAERVAAAILPHVARGPPTALLVQLDAVNTGNVALDADVVVRAADGSELARADLGGLPQGRRDLVTLHAALPPTTPPGRLSGTLDVVQDDETLATVPVEMEVLAWSEMDVQAEPRPDGAWDVRVTHRGNARAVRDVVLLDVPPGVDARPSRSRIDLDPGASSDFVVHLASSPGAASGLFRMQLALVDPAPGNATAGPHLAPLTLDLRAAKLEIADVRRSVDAPAEGARVAYRTTVRNDGAKEARGVPVELYVDGFLVDRREVDGLAPGESTVVELSWTARSGAHGIVVAVDPHGPLAGSTAFTERVEVAASLVPGAAAAREVPAPWTAWILLALVAIALLRRRTF